MAGIIYVDDVEAEGSSGQMLITFKSGGDTFRFHLPPNLALRFNRKLNRFGWEELCASDAKVIPLPKRSKKKAKA